MSADKLKTGQTSITASAQQLTTSRLETDDWSVRALSTNVGNVAIGPSGVTTSTGYLLEPGDEFSFGSIIAAGHPVYDLRPDELYVVGTSGDKVTWLAWLI
jgi:hypothetical protein